ncbi:ArsR/SmtB family transcription factor [Chitinibacteraceae bacterium HSL-7]
MRTPHHPAREALTLEGVLYALSDPVRLGVVRCLAKEGAQSCGAMSLPVAKSTASHHFRVLREAGLLCSKPEGTQFINTLRRDDIDARFPGLLDAVLAAA